MKGVRECMSVARLLQKCLQQIGRVPFTLTMLIGISIAGYLTGTPTSTINPVQLKRWGFALHDLWQGTWYSLVTEVFFTTHPSMFWGILGLVIGSIGLYEWQAGTGRSLRLYWLTDIVGSLLVTLGFVLPLYLAKTPLGLALAFDDDVGMSGGGFGCVGGWVHRLPQVWRRRVFVGVLVYLVGHLIIVTDLFSDILHIVTFFLGFWLDGQLPASPTSKTPNL